MLENAPMIVVVTEHWTEPARLADAEARIDGQAARMQGFDGFLFRFRMGVADDPTRVTTLTAWRSAEALAAWTAAREASRGEPFGFARIEQTTYEVAGETWPPAGR
jgi:heme-degrading monooxygenase HmoA